jgi:sensor histidine kinase YesM
MILFKKSSLIFYFLFVVQSVFGQSFTSKNISINDGLPSNSIKCFYKDSRGLMWIGTEAGLCCYDGSTIKIYNESNGLLYNEVWSIAEDNQHNLWLSLYGIGLAKFNGTKFTYFSKKDGLISNCIRKIVYSKKNNCLILGTENGLSLFDGRHTKSFKFNTSLGKFQIVGINKKNEDLYYITVSKSDVFTLRISKDLEKSELKTSFTPATKLYSSYLSNDTFFGGSSEPNLLVYNLKTKHNTELKSPIIWDFTEDNNHNIYGAAWNVINPAGGLFKFSNGILTDFTKKLNIKSNSLWCLYFDETYNTLWIGSIDKGVYLINLSNQFNFFKSSSFNLNQLDIQCIYNDYKDNKWIGAQNNIIILHPNFKYSIIDSKQIWSKVEQYLKRFKVLPYSIETYNIYKKKSSFTCLNITADKDNNIWVTTTLGVFCFDENYNLLYFNFSDGGHIGFDDKDRLFFGEMYSNLYCSKNKFAVKFEKEFNISNVNIPRDIFKIISDHDKLWFASYSNGLYLFQKDNFTSFNLNNQFTEKYIKDIIADKNGDLIIGTNSGKIFFTSIVDGKLKIKNVLLPNVDLIGTSISFIEESNEFYFIGTNKGINIFKNQKFIKLLDQSEGIADLQFNDCSKDKKGNLWVANNEGVFCVDVAKILTNLKNDHFIRIMNIKVNEKIVSDTIFNEFWNFHDKIKVNLNYNENDIEINFINYNIFNANKNLFRYRILGLSNNWSQFDNLTKIKLNGISPGNYKIIIQGKNVGTGQVLKSKFIELRIKPPFWNTIWFYLSITTLIVMILLLIYKNRIKSIQNKNAIFKRIAETKMEALQSQMNPHFIFNAMNSIQNYIIKNDIDKALMYLSEFSKLIRQTLNNSTLSKITLASELNYLNTYVYLENMRFNNKIDFKVNLSDNIDVNYIELPPMLIQPLIENAFIHAFDTDSINPIIELNFTLIDVFLICEIIDNGKGFDTKEIIDFNNSKGFKLINERISLIQDFSMDCFVVNSKPSIGTTIVLKIKIFK